MKKGYVAGCLVFSLAGTELAESKEISLANARKTDVQSQSTATLAWNPHVHFELDTEVRATTAVPIFASGHQHSEERFRLFIQPVTLGFKLIGHLMPSEMDGTSQQHMYGFSPSIESLTEVLSSKLGIPTGQIEAIRRTAIEGGVQEIGGSRSPILHLFRRTELERAGMSFRPPDL